MLHYKEVNKYINKQKCNKIRYDFSKKVVNKYIQINYLSIYFIQ